MHNMSIVRIIIFMLMGCGPFIFFPTDFRQTDFWYAKCIAEETQINNKNKGKLIKFLTKFSMLHCY